MFSTDGIIQSNTTNNTFVQCTTTHLTSFAVLVDTTGVRAAESCALYIISHCLARVDPGDSPMLTQCSFRVTVFMTICSTVGN